MLRHLDVVDTAVKIGLGAVVSGIVALAAIHLNARNDWRKVKQLHRLKVLEKIAAEIQKDVASFFETSGKLHLFLVRGAEQGLSEDTIARLNDFTKSREAHVVAVTDLYGCCAQLDVIGGAEGSKVLREFTRYVNNTSREVGLPETIEQFKAAIEVWDQRTRRGAELHHDVRAMLSQYFEKL